MTKWKQTFGRRAGSLAVCGLMALGLAACSRSSSSGRPTAGAATELAVAAPEEWVCGA